MSIKLLVLLTALMFLMTACGGSAAIPTPMPVVTPLPGQLSVVEHIAAPEALRATLTPIETRRAVVYPTARPKSAVSLLTTYKDGIYVVGSQIKPGTYRTVGTPSTCNWARLSGFGGSGDDIIANDFGAGSRIVTISRTDTGFKSTGCGGWYRLDN